MLSPMSNARRIVSSLLLSALAVVLPVRSALAEDNGWFEAPAQTAPTPVTAQASVSAAAPASAPPLDSGAQLEDGPDLVDRDPRALSDFRAELDPYGSWVQHPSYGTLWVPSPQVVGTSFSPYVSAGRWALDDAGNWVWVSDYPFGRVVFHYGRWVWASGVGWGWVPGYRYAPAWVSWRVPVAGDPYIGWAPLPPTYIWMGGYPVSYWYSSRTPWVFCPSSYLFHSHVHSYVVRDRGLVTHLASTTRRYYAPAAPRIGGGRSAFGWSRSPTLAAARVPHTALPRDRLRAAPHIGTPRSEVFRGDRDFRRSDRGRDFGRAPAPMYRDSRGPMPRGEHLSPRMSGPRSSAPRYDAGSRMRFSAPRSEPRMSAPRMSAPRMSAPRMSPRMPSMGGSRRGR